MTLREVQKRFPRWRMEYGSMQYEARRKPGLGSVGRRNPWPWMTVVVGEGDQSRAKALRVLSAMIAAAEKEMEAT